MKLFFVAALCAVTAAAEPTPLETALATIRMSPHDLRFQKDMAASAFVLPVARLCLQQPLALPTLAEDTRHHLAALNNLAGFAPLAAGFLDAKTAQAALNPSHPALSLPPELPPALTNAVQRLYATAHSLQPHLPRPDPAIWEAFALSSFSTKAERALYAPGLHQRDEALELQDDEIARTLLEAGNRLDCAELLTAFATLCQVLDELLPSLRALQTTNQFQHSIETPLGAICLGGVGPNTYTFTNSPDPLLIIDLGGADHYHRGRQDSVGGSTAGIAVSLDLGDGNDRYEAEGLGGLGAGIFGLGVLIDCGGDDTYTGQHITEGAGVFGCGLLADFGGQDKFTAQSFAQGAGAFGVGILWQRGGNTVYRAAEKAQAYAGTLGVGLLLDDTGNDQYRTGGGAPCRWLDGHSFTLAQGMAIGTRPFAGGGVAVLCDLAGHDTYEADVYGQGASYWYAVGLLLDGAGNDSYKSHQYAQGAGIHLSSGLLWDGAGNDTYHCHAICQGGAHDYSVGMLIEDAGNDRYTADSTAQGSAINNSFALLLDRAGNDNYTGTDPKQSQAAGHDGGRREYGAIAVLLDLGGHDNYSQGWTNNASWTKPFYGAGLDTVWGARPAVRDWRLAGSEAVPEPVREPAGNPSQLPQQHVDVRHPIERLVRRATRDWETPAEKVDTEAADAELKTRAAEALAYLVKRLDSPSVMLRAKTEELVDHLGTNAIPLLIEGVRAAPSAESARVCCHFLARFESATNAIPVLLPLLDREATRTTALYTLGHLQAQDAFGAAVSALASDREPVRLRAAQALGRIGHPHAIPKLIPLLNDEIFSVRYAAETALIAFGWRSIEPLQHALREATPRARPHIRAALTQLKPRRRQ